MIRSKKYQLLTLPNLIKWYEKLQTVFKDKIDHTFHPSILTRRQLKEVVKEEIAKKENSEFLDEVSRKNLSRVKELLDSGTNLESEEPRTRCKAIHIACEKGDIQMCELLL